MPFLGIPSTFKIIFAVVFGIMVMALGFLVREERKWLLRALSGDHQADAYTESRVPKAEASGEIKQDYVFQATEHST
jgi:hypothetical protein